MSTIVNVATVIICAIAFAFVPAATVRAEDSGRSVAGLYDVEARGDAIGVLTFVLRLEQRDGAWTGEIRDSRVPITVTGVEVDGASLRVTAVAGAGGQLSFAGAWSDGAIAGEWTMNASTGTWRATRAANSEPSASRGQRYPNQFAQDWRAGRVPTDDEIADAERAAAADPSDRAHARRLAKGYFFQYFGANDEAALPKAREHLSRSLEVDADDAEIAAYLGALYALEATRSLEGERRDAAFRRALALLDRSLELDSNHGAVLSIASATFLWFPESYGQTPRAAALTEHIRKLMGPAFARFSHHGQQRILLTQGQAYARMGRVAEARECFEMGLRVNEKSLEGALLAAELAKLGEK